MIRAAALLLLLAAAGPAPSVQRLSSLELAYDAAAWAVTKIDHDRWSAVPAEQGAQTVHIRTDYAGPCSQEAMAALAETTSMHERSRGTATLPSGLIAHWAEGSTGCRNATAGPVAACVAHQGGATLFTAASGCRFSAYADDTPMTLLQGLRPRF